QLIKTGKVSRGRIGIQIQEVNAQLASSFGLDRPRGALIGGVEPNGPGEAAGLKSGDIIMKIDGQPIETSLQVPQIIANTAAGKTVTLDVWRERKMKSIDVRVAPLDESNTRTALNDSNSGDPAGKLGLSLRPLSPQEQKQAQTDGKL